MLCLPPKKTLDRLVSVAVTLFALATIYLLFGCSPNGMINGGTGPGRPQYPLALVIHNGDTAYVETMTVVWWEHSAIVGSTTAVAPKGGDATFSLWCPNQAHPTGFMITNVAWPAPYGNTFGYPDYAGTDIFVVDFPSGGSRKQP